MTHTDRADDAAITVVHLALRSYGVEALAQFVSSYRLHPAGAGHRLVLALKGFDNLEDARPFTSLLDGLTFEARLVPDFGLDIGTYVDLARTIETDYLCFFNSRSVILADDWLAKLLAAAQMSGVGVSGATGSYQGLPSDTWRVPRQYNWRLLRRIKRAMLYPGKIFAYPGFPNPHVRTNAFLIARALFLSLDLPRIRGKSDAMRFESGRNGMTRQIVARGLRPVLVDRDGGVHDVDAWAAADIFWQRDQHDLLVADNQTGIFDAADPAMRDWYTDHAWRPVFSDAGTAPTSDSADIPARR